MATKTATTSSTQLPAQRTNSNILSGKIMWLPAQHDIPPNLLQPGLDHGAYNHPVVIMSRKSSSEGLVEIFLITSFGSRSIAEAHSPNWKPWLHYTPIQPAVHPAYPNTQLRLVDGSTPMEKPSYINARKAYFVQLEALRPYRGSGVAPVLDRASLKELRHLSSFIDLFNPRTPKNLRDYKLWVLDASGRKGEAHAQPPPPLPAGRVITNPYFPAFPWLAQTPSTQMPSIQMPSIQTPSIQPFSGCFCHPSSAWSTPHYQYYGATTHFSGVPQTYTSAY
ncbi:hypothetical protein LZ30DRAFT_745249 [Colletotrichum cereale]|nr:hypothetical protein LZ30DRAFT_745249 [Colletotrichum cereale]